ncbi:nucleotidyltransferase domain-containing protein [Virgibacillus ihumii]|uniref:nucleotidyltransferase domain-containing protein n=1 Tax=Virgibacillus ihumii TaxID=2686091 RepID=UPI00157CE4E6|nr:nucleotidyltransferase domain-containing protein [Virgibacillus ihumii]
MFGLTDKDIKLITEALDGVDEIENAFIFGSRALGNYKKGSDVDIAIGGRNVTWGTAATLSETLNEELPLPYYFDILDYNAISNHNLTAHIEQYGVQIYDKGQHMRKI